MGKRSLPPGFRFHPTDVELVKYYLKRKILGKKMCFKAISEIDIYKHAPWDLPDKSCLRTGDLKWFFFCPMEKKYARGARLNRATEYGYWKTTGKDRAVIYNNATVGMIRTLVFHHGKAPKGERTDWVMHEYRLEEKDLADRGVVQHTYVLCVIFQKDGPGPRNGAQYGAPFREEDWSDDEEVVDAEALFPSNLTTPSLVEPVNPMNSAATSSRVPGDLYHKSLVDNSFHSDTLPMADKDSALVSVASKAPKCMETPHITADSEEVMNAGAVSPAGLSTPFHAAVYRTSSVDTHSFVSEGICHQLIGGSYPSGILPCANQESAVVAAANNTRILAEAPQASIDDDIQSMLAIFTENCPWRWNKNGLLEQIQPNTSNDGEGPSSAVWPMLASQQPTDKFASSFHLPSSSECCPFNVLPAAGVATAVPFANDGPPSMEAPEVPVDEEIVSMLAAFREDSIEHNVLFPF